MESQERRQNEVNLRLEKLGIQPNKEVFRRFNIQEFTSTGFDNNEEVCYIPCPVCYDSLSCIRINILMSFHCRITQYMMK